jgi:hypothetical protein
VVRCELDGIVSIGANDIPVIRLSVSLVDAFEFGAQLGDGQVLLSVFRRRYFRLSSAN